MLVFWNFFEKFKIYVLISSHVTPFLPNDTASCNIFFLCCVSSLCCGKHNFPQCIYSSTLAILCARRCCSALNITFHMNILQTSAKSDGKVRKKWIAGYIHFSHALIIILYGIYCKCTDHLQCLQAEEFSSRIQRIASQVSAADCELMGPKF